MDNMTKSIAGKERQSDVPLATNAVTCDICQSPANRYSDRFICQANLNHVGDLTVGIFSDQTPPSSVTAEPQINFASDVIVRAAIFDVLDAGQWELNSSDESDEETERRYLFASAVQKRICELQSPPHHGVRLENLCERHRRQALPKPTVLVCEICEKEKVRK